LVKMCLYCRLKLNQNFKIMTKKLLASLVLTIIFAMQVYAQGRTVSGKVTDKKGEAIPGANIVVKGNTAIATVTGDNGTYSLANVPEKAILMFSATGFTEAEIAVGSENVVNFTLNDDETLGVVLVEGAAGIKRDKLSIGTSQSKVDGSILNQGAAFGAAAGLQGKIAGLQINIVDGGVNSASRITLRGNRSILGNNQALIVINGSQSTQAAFDLLNPNDIESVTALKGQASSAAYGSDASNGVLLVTTKKGKAGETRVTFSTTYQVQQVAYLPKLQDRFGPGTGRNNLYEGGENQSYGAEFDGSIRNLGGTLSSGTDVTGQTLEDGSVNTVVYSPIKNQKLNAFNTGTILQNNASVSGGSGNTTFFMSVQDQLTKGVIDRDQNRRIGVNFGGETKAGKLTAEFNVNYVNSASDQTAGDFYGDLLQVAANIPINSYRNWENFTNPDGTLNAANPNNYYSAYSQNPWFTLDNSRNVTARRSFTGNANIKYEVAPWFNIIYRPGIVNTNTNGKLTQGKFTYRDYAASPAGRPYKLPNTPGFVRDNTSSNTKITQELQLAFNKKFSPSWKGDLVLAANVNDIATQNVRLATTSVVIPGLFNINNRLGEAVTDPNFNFVSAQRVIGIFADASIGFKDFLFLHGTVRNDWTSLLDAGNNSYLYPEADIALVISNAIPALRNSKSLSFAKITASAAKVGQVSLDPYQTRSIYTVGAGFPYGGSTSLSVGNTFVRQGIKPEFTTTYEVGMELGFFDRINLKVDAYKNQTVNQTLPIGVSVATGYTQLRTNVGATEGRGLEIALGGDVVKMKNGFVWNVNANYAYNDNRVTELFDDVKSIAVRDPLRDAALQESNGGVFAVVGQQYPTLQVSDYAKDPQGRVIVDAGTGLPSLAATQTTAGSTTPVHILGLNTTLSYKGFSLTALAEYRGGNVFYHDNGVDLVTGGVAAVTATYNRERFIFPNSSILNGTGADGQPAYIANTTVPIGSGAEQNGGYSYWDNNYKTFGSNFVTSGAFWKLREVRLSYEIPKSILAEGSKYIKGASVSFVGRNLLMFLPKSNQFGDPEAGTSNSNAQGVSNSFNPPFSRTYGLNLTITL
jgi:TonB-linked SusC/RagA family outer membrane protein